MQPLERFRAATFAGANLSTLLPETALGSLLFFPPFNLIHVHGYSIPTVGAAWLLIEGKTRARA